MLHNPRTTARLPDYPLIEEIKEENQAKMNITAGLVVTKKVKEKYHKKRGGTIISIRNDVLVFVKVVVGKNKFIIRLEYVKPKIIITGSLKFI